MATKNEMVEAKKVCTKRFLNWGSSDETAMFSASNRVAVMAASANAKTNINAVGIGKKIVKGQTTTDSCIRIYVTQKLPPSLLSAASTLPSAIDGIPTDIIESEPAFMNISGAIATDANLSCSNNRKQQQRPLMAGISLSHPQVTAGTIAYFCHSTNPTDINHAEQVYLLSNNHVLADVNRGKMGDDIYQPGVLDGGIAINNVAKLHRLVELQLGGQVANEVDAAIAILNDNINYQVSICSIGTVTGTNVALENMEVVKHGRTSGYTEGIVTDESLDINVGIDHNNPNVIAKFEDQFRIDRLATAPHFALGGDSGSLIVSKGDNKAVGLYFAGPASGTYGIANQIEVVLDQLQIKLL